MMYLGAVEALKYVMYWKSAANRIGALGTRAMWDALMETRENANHDDEVDDGCGGQNGYECGDLFWAKEVKCLL